MAEPNAADVKLDDDGKPITEPGPGEGGAEPPKKDPKPADGGDGVATPEPEEDLDPASIPVRQSNAQFIIARKNKKIAKLESEANKGDEEPEGEPDANIQEVVSQTLTPVVETLTKQIDEGELRDFFREEPEAKNYEKRMRVYLAHPAYKGVHPSVIYHHLSFAGSQAAAVKKKSAADLEANQTRGGGRAIKPKSGENGLPSADEINAMSDDELERLQNKVMSGGR